MNMQRILLASKSERRFSWLRENLVEKGLEIDAMELISHEIEPTQGLEVRKQVEMVCRSKAENARIEYELSKDNGKTHYDAIIVSDTMIEDPNDHKLSIGKPIDDLAATGMLIRLSGGKHIVWSSTSILLPPQAFGGDRINEEWNISNYTNCATVEFSNLSDDEIYELISSKSWKGKAGGYDLAGMAGRYCHVVEGSEVTVLGFSSLAIDGLIDILSIRK